MIRAAGRPAKAKRRSSSATAIASKTTIAIFIAVTLSLIRVTTNKCYHWKKQQNPANGEEFDENMDGISEDSPLAGDVMADLEREQLVRESIEMLPPRCRQMITLLFFEHPPQPYTEVAEKLGLARGSIGFIRGRCLKRLKRILEDKGF